MSLNIDTTYTGETFKQLGFTNAVVSDSVFSECRFVNCDFSETVFQSCRFIDCELKDCTMRMIQVENTTFSKVHFVQCDLLGVNWAEANWADWVTKMGKVTFEKCNLKYSVFFGLYLPSTMMIDCNAQEVNFAEANLAGSDFSGTDFAEAIFLRTDISKANFIGAKNYAMNLNDNKTKGAKFSLPEAMQLLFHLDIELCDPVTHARLNSI